MTELGEPRQARLLPYRRVGPVGNLIEVYATTRLGLWPCLKQSAI